MAVLHYDRGVKQGVSERYENITTYLISRCEYAHGTIFSGAALINFGSIDPEGVMESDLAYEVALFKDGVQVGRDRSERLFGTVKY